ncbi:hypothetical protein IC235_14130 [Hymenobacter sp. BT664]|uniref:Uncharacterized protein n=1 Tax=Hymenobacter montanus TaxID=2771359 RepID=A0A927BDW9_9BACT|nr:hypothetical protein [Hymenobacter montanus]MBD2769027.1 hypothetical protein [Hymenobacter montanus]
MHQLLKTLQVKLSGPAAWATTALILALGAAGCKNTTVPAPETGRDYYPVAVGNFWVYAVVDTTWSPATRVSPSVATISTYQFKETITDVFTDAAGQPAYRLVRSKRVAPATTFLDDSVFVLSATPQTVTLIRNNARTLELIFPVREGRLWNFNAYNNNFNDTITAETRRYSRVGQSFTTGGTGGIPAATYPSTLTTANAGIAAENSLLKRQSYQQVFAKGVGPVYRRRDYFLNFNYTNSDGTQVYVPGSYFSAASRRETLIDYGPR